MFHNGGIFVKYNQDEIDDFMIANFVKKNKAFKFSIIRKR